MTDERYARLAEMCFYNELLGGNSYDVAKSRTVAKFPKMFIVDKIMINEGKGSYFENRHAAYETKKVLVETIMGIAPNNKEIKAMAKKEHDESSDPLDVLNTALIKRFKLNKTH